MRDEPRDRDWLSDRLAERADWEPNAPNGDGWQQRAFADLAELDTAGIERAVASLELDRSAEVTIDPTIGTPTIAAVLDRQFEALEAAGRFEAGPDEIDVLSDLASDSFAAGDEDPLSALIAATSPSAVDDSVAVSDPFDTEAVADRSISTATDDRPDELLDDITALVSGTDEPVPAHLPTPPPDSGTDTGAVPPPEQQDIDPPHPLGSDDATDPIGDVFDTTVGHQDPVAPERDLGRDEDHGEDQDDDSFDLGGEA